MEQWILCSCNGLVKTFIYNEGIGTADMINPLKINMEHSWGSADHDRGIKDGGTSR